MSEEILSLELLNKMLDSEQALLASDLDCLDGCCDGIVLTSILNEWRVSKGLAPDDFNFATTIPLIDAIRYIKKVEVLELS